MKEEEQAAAQRKSSLSLFGGGGSSVKDKSGTRIRSPSTVGVGGVGVSPSKRSLMKLLQNLEERGQKLQNAADKSEQMLDAFKEFNRIALRKLSRQQR